MITVMAPAGHSAQTQGLHLFDFLKKKLHHYGSTMTKECPKIPAEKHHELKLQMMSLTLRKTKQKQKLNNLNCGKHLITLL